MNSCPFPSSCIRASSAVMGSMLGQRGQYLGRCHIVWPSDAALISSLLLGLARIVENVLLRMWGWGTLTAMSYACHLRTG